MFLKFKQSATISAQLLFLSFFLLLFQLATAQQQDKIIININVDSIYQTIRNFGASDAWSGQFAGNWPDAKKNAIADWLFSTDTLANGNPKGIGLSLWRYNLGAGSAEQEDNSGIKDEWRRAALTTGNSEKVQAQNWFLKAAKQRGVTQFLGFFNSPPVALTKNNKAFAHKGICNIDSTNYAAFANYAMKAMQQIKDETGISFNYISPVNEPQWDWSDSGQEGSPYTNKEIAGIVKAFNKAFQQDKTDAKLLITESGSLTYLLPAGDKRDKDEQVNDFFNAASPLYVGNLSNITYAIAAHSYFTTSPFNKAIKLRAAVNNFVSKIKDLEYWQSEYCILGDNAGEINGDKRDTGMSSALYLARVIYTDLVYGNASAWQWWLAISPYNYKDGLIYIDKNEKDGNYHDSKMLWAMGNYSRFIRPGMKRIKMDMSMDSLYASSFADAAKHRLVLVFVNTAASKKAVGFSSKTIPSNKKIITYTTSATQSLEKKIIAAKDLAIPAKSVITVVYEP
ncbi:glycoside hydrolase [Parafilimonas sp.]|uniref:glycoside hydrolase n=1 Tax=Parafilimonas sp. TaxID=1969739 RepID=UPI0039E7165E